MLDALLVVVLLGTTPGCPPGEAVGNDLTCQPPCPAGKHLEGLLCVPDRPDPYAADDRWGSA
jgi:hypothetical protein